MADSDGLCEGVFESVDLRLEVAAQPQQAVDAQPLRIVDLRLQLVEVDDGSGIGVASGVQAAGTIVNNFDARAGGRSEIVDLMHSMDGPEEGNRQYYENHSMLGAPREDLNLSPALTDVEQDDGSPHAEATAQVRATLLAFNRAWGQGCLLYTSPSPRDRG